MHWGPLAVAQSANLLPESATGQQSGQEERLPSRLTRVRRAPEKLSSHKLG